MIPCRLMTVPLALLLAGGGISGGNAAPVTSPSDARVLTSRTGTPGMLPPSVRNEAHQAINRGLDWLAEQQKENGAWSDENFPALTALSLWCFIEGEHPQKKEIVERAVTFILSCVRRDGGIYREVPNRKGGGLSNYNTSICMTALHRTGDRKHIPIVLAARRFVARSQYFGDDVYEGGMGYDASTKRAYTDLLNTYYAAEAMRLTASAEDARPAGTKPADLDWDAAQRFLRRVQNTAAAGADETGGFIYNPTDATKGGQMTNEAGVVLFRSYGSMTYAGLMGLLYADVKPNDPRVRSAVGWAARHWTLEENPGMGQQGLYFFYSILTKALSAYRVPQLDAAGGWRLKVVNKLLNLQTIENKTGHGYWKNENGRFMEKNEILVTAYSILALEMIAHE